MVRGRFAPSPTGLLHLGNARSALLGWLQARAAGGEFLLRIEDLDPDRCRPQYIDALYRDLEWLGLTWDGPVLKQSERAQLYREALGVLDAKGLTFFCTCSRADLQRAASAPHEGEDGPVYPGTCRNGVTQPGRPASVRFRARGGLTRFVDLIHGEYTQDVAQQVGDFVIRRADGVASYQLAVVVDDAAQGVTEVVRGDDLLPSTARQYLLRRALGLPEPAYFHVPLVVDTAGRRLAKRADDLSLAELRDRGVDARAIASWVARTAGIADARQESAAELASRFSMHRVPHSQVSVSSQGVVELLGAR